MSRIYADIIYIPHAIEVDGQIIKIYDPSIHKEVKSLQGDDGNNAIRKEALDRRYVACKRPIIITGGELTLEMLDLRYDESAKYYEAPLHMKALGGTFIIDDFGRQLVKPEQLLNRWIVPLESRVDFLKLHTGKTFSIPFDEIVVFSTNLEPNDLMDPAFLRRIPYKLEIKAPSREEYRRIFRLIATQRGVEMPDDVATLVIEELQTSNGFQLACYQPRFVVDQVIAACKYLDVPRPSVRSSCSTPSATCMSAAPGARRSRRSRPSAPLFRLLVNGRPCGARCRFMHDTLDASG
jgi:hypothetical protein